MDGAITRKSVSVRIAHAIGLAIAVFAVATPAAHAGAKVLVSAPIANSAGGIYCGITNAGTKPVTVSAMETYGGTRGTRSLVAEPVTLPPGGYIGTASGEIFGYCRFVIDKNPKTVRAVACKFALDSPTGSTFECVEAH
jgi:hypothetical protein